MGDFVSPKPRQSPDITARFPQHTQRSGEESRSSPPCVAIIVGFAHSIPTQAGPSFLVTLIHRSAWKGIS
jgi:hypothetical protein